MQSQREEIIELMWCDMVSGVTRYQIDLKLQNDTYFIEGRTEIHTNTLSRSSRYYYMQDVLERCKAELGEKRDAEVALVVSQFKDVYNEARENHDRGNAIAALKELSKLRGYYEPEKVDVSGNISVNVDFGLGDDEEDEPAVQD